MIIGSESGRRSIGWFFETLFLVFVSFLSISATPGDTFDKNKTTSFCAAELNETPVGRGNQHSDSNPSVYSKAFSIHQLSSFPCVDLPSLKITTAKAFFINIFERSIFYVHTTINAP